MPEQTNAWLAALLVGVVIAIALLVHNAITTRRTRRDVRRVLDDLDLRARTDASIDRQVRLYLHQAEPPEEEPPHRRLWLVPAVALLAGAGVWLKSLPGPVLGGTAAAAGVTGLVTLLVFSGPSQESAMPEPPRPPAVVAPTRTPSDTITLPSLPSPGPASTTSSPGGGSPPTTEAELLPPTVATTSMLTSLPTSTTTTEAPTSTTVVPPPTSQTCLLRLELGKLAKVCLPAVHL